MPPLERGILQEIAAHKKGPAIKIFVGRIGREYFYTPPTGPSLLEVYKREFTKGQEVSLPIPDSDSFALKSGPGNSLEAYGAIGTFGTTYPQDPDIREVSIRGIQEAAGHDIKVINLDTKQH